MKQVTIMPQRALFGNIDSIATDKSLSHRCAIFSLLAQKPSRIKGYLHAEDTLNTLKIAQLLGLSVKEEKSHLILTPPKHIDEPSDILDCGNAGTAMRLYAGLLSGLNSKYFVLSGDVYLNQRPMKRIIAPLRDMGAIIFGRRNNTLAPLSIKGSSLRHFSYVSPIASAQVKSAMILAALKADGISYYKEPEISRNHTEKMLRAMGANIKELDSVLHIEPLVSALDPIDMEIPSDPSSAFFFAVAAAIVPQSEILLKNVLLNPTRIEAFEVLKKMGADVHYIKKTNAYDDVGDIYVKYAQLKGVEITTNISWLIDEIPALSIAMANAQGISVVRNARELRVKECDRIEAIVQNLRSCGINANAFEDGFEIVGGNVAQSRVDSFGDHRIAMSFALMGLLVPITIMNAQVMSVSFPHFLDIMKQYAIIQE